MSHAYVIEIEHAAVGLIVREEGYRFFASSRSAWALNCQSIKRHAAPFDGR